MTENEHLDDGIKCGCDGNLVWRVNKDSQEHDNPRYILHLPLLFITISVKTADIVDNLPKLEF
jgi:hypothetical protein